MIVRKALIHISGGMQQNTIAAKRTSTQLTVIFAKPLNSIQHAYKSFNPSLKTYLNKAFRCQNVGHHFWLLLYYISKQTSMDMNKLSSGFGNKAGTSFIQRRQDRWRRAGRTHTTALLDHSHYYTTACATCYTLHHQSPPNTTTLSQISFV